MMSSRAAIALSYEISGFGLASANTIGLSAMLRTISCVSTSATDKPRNTSAPTRASSSVSTSRVVANLAFAAFRFWRRTEMTPLLSHMITFSGFTPSAM